jgi:ribosomal protein S18 acetylase RimI-like enzyme
VISSSRSEVAVRAIRKQDAASITRIDAMHTGTAKRKWWEGVIARHLRRSASVGLRVGLVAVDARGSVAGFLFGQVRAFEFGSDPCGWIFAVGVRPEAARCGVASRLLAEAKARFQEAGIPVVRTMVRNDDVPVLTFFRSQGFAAGPFVELELTLEETRP